MKISRTFLFLAFVAFSTAACDGLLDVSDPTRVEEKDLTGPTGVELLRAEAITQLYNAVSISAYHGGLVADEFFYIPSRTAMQSGTIQTQTRLDQRMLRDGEALRTTTRVYNDWNIARVAATHAINWFERYGGESQRPAIGQLLAAKGLATLALGEQICEGFPLHDVDWDRPVYSGPLTTDEVFEEAVEILEDAVEAAGDNAEYANFANVSLARALLGLGRFAEAGEVAARVPTDFVFNGEYGTANPAKRNQMRFTMTSATVAANSVADRKGGTGIDFLSANDPRLALTHLGTSHQGSEIYAPTKYQATNAPITISSGVEARLIEAEAAIHAGSPAWLDILNDLRATQVSPAMDPLTDPGSFDARVDLLFRERAFWLFGTGHRLGDLRRLIAHYGREAEDVFPSGEYHLGGVYEQWTSMPFSLEGEDWAKMGVTGCLD